MRAPRRVFAERSSANASRAHLRGRTLPIIIVPDLFCTRLADARTGDLVWNPRGSPFGADPGGFKIDLARLGQMSRELVPDTKNIFAERSKNDEAYLGIWHGRSMMLDLHHDLTVELFNARGDEARRLGTAREIFFCGYDWRQDNARSALRLATMVEEALEQCHERKVVLVGHGMGGAICRYYCRALGGEAKVHELFLVGSPVTGSPAAYGLLKHGLEGHYVREVEEMFLAGDDGSAVFECASEVAAAIAGAAAATSAGEGVAAVLGELYMKLCLSAGRWLSREETRSLLRAMPSVYQLLPGAVHCKSSPFWVAFDPLATGVAPTGYMVPMPTGLARDMAVPAAVLDAASREEALGTELNAFTRRMLEGPSAGVPSARATRNAMPFVEMMERAIALQVRGGTMLAEVNWDGDLGDEFEQHGIEGIVAEAKLLMPAFQGFFAQAGRTFIDGRNPKRLYEDPHTGLCDVVAERPLTAVNLALAYRFDEALTVTPREEPAVSIFDLLAKLLEPFAAWLKKGLRDWAFRWAADWTSDPDGVVAEWTERSDAAAADRAAQTKQDEALRTRFEPRAYLPPRSYAVFSESELTLQGCVLYPRAYVSLDDSNVVRTEYFPNLIPPLGLAPGDGSVPAACAYPDAARLSRPFAGKQVVAGVGAAALAGAADTIDFINRTLDAGLVEFCKS